MPQDDSALIRAGDLAAALGLLTRLPVRVDGAAAQARGAGSAWAWPVAGALTGGIAGATGLVAIGLGLGPALAAGLVLVAGTMLSGAMHEDGLADSCDGLWGGWTPARRLEIMKDSAIGTYGVLALVLAMLLRWAALSTLFDAGAVLGPLVGAAALSRVPMVVILGSLPNARGAGLSQSVGQPRRATMWLAVATGFGLGFFALGSAVWPATAAAGLAGLGVAWLARARIGGQTGDILGAAQVVAEVAVLLVLAALWG